MPIHGHYWTIAPAIKLALFPPRSRETRAWKYQIEDESGLQVLLTGQWREISDSKTLGVVIHGLGGDPSSASVLQIANAMERKGWSTLRYAMRGSQSGLDFYHSGLSKDVTRALTDPRFARYDEIFIAGLSLGAAAWAPPRRHPAPPSGGTRPRSRCQARFFRARPRVTRGASGF